jgi:5S rRNA maturation endonuclease (ribonuclease M5)
MPNISIRGRPIDVDIHAELEQFDWGYRAKWTGDRLIAQSPFRDDSSPSFYVYIEETATAPAGSWGDSGGDGEYAKGNFVKLLAFLRNESEEETEDYLLSTYSTEQEDFTNSLDLSQYQTKESSAIILADSVIEPYRYRHTYLEERGVSEAVQRAMKVGYDRDSNAVTIPWFDAQGKLRNVKYRRVDSKVFWYYKGATPIRELVYGIDFVYKWRKTVAVLCEAEIDAMTAMSAGYAAVAVGGSSFNAMKADIISRSPIETLYIATDNDEAGRKLKAQVIWALKGSGMVLYDLQLPHSVKDVNDLGVANIRQSIEEATRVRTLGLLGS